MEQKLCTSMEQSKKLLELGLSVDTADCYWKFDLTFKSYHSMFMDNQYDNICVPAWSLPALLELMPQINDYSPIINKFDNCVFCAYIDEDATSYKEYRGKDFIDVAFEMVCWLLEQGFIEKGGEK